MKIQPTRMVTAVLSVACIASISGCYPAYPPANQDYASIQDSSKGYDVAQEPVAPQVQRYGVDPGLAIAGAAMAGLLGYAIADNRGYHHHYGYYGPRYYGPRYYHSMPYRGGYYGPRHYH